MKTEIQNAQLNKWSVSMIVFAVLTAISVGPMMGLVGTKGLIISLGLFGVSLYSANKIERIKKKHNLKTYKEILAFQEGRKLTDDEREESRTKHKYHKALIVILFGIISGMVTWLSLFFFNM